MRHIWVAIATALVALLPLPAWAYVVHGPYFTDTTLTHSAIAPELDAAMAEAIALWGQHSAIRDGGAGSAITVREGESFEAIGNGETCTISVLPIWPRMSREDLVLFLAHELGHCLGLWHSDVEQSIMTSPAYGIQADDRAAIASLYPARPRMVVGGVAHD